MLYFCCFSYVSMALKCLVKLNAVNNLSDARYAAGMGVELLGFDLTQESGSYISPQEFAAITGWVSGVSMVGEVRSLERDQIKMILEKYALDMIEVSDPLHSDLGELPLPLIIKLVNPAEDYLEEILRKFHGKARFFMLEFDKGLQNPALQENIRKWARDYPVILGGYLSNGNIEEILDQGVAGIALTGGRELRPGYKDFDELAEILEALEINDMI